MDATLEQFINYIDNSARDKLENDEVDFRSQPNTLSR